MSSMWWTMRMRLESSVVGGKLSPSIHLASGSCNRFSITTRTQRSMDGGCSSDVATCCGTAPTCCNDHSIFPTRTGRPTTQAKVNCPSGSTLGVNGSRDVARGAGSLSRPRRLKFGFQVALFATTHVDHGAVDDIREAELVHVVGCRRCAVVVATADALTCE